MKLLVLNTFAHGDDYAEPPVAVLPLTAEIMRKLAVLSAAASRVSEELKQSASVDVLSDDVILLENHPLEDEVDIFVEVSEEDWAGLQEEIQDFDTKTLRVWVSPEGEPVLRMEAYDYTLGVETEDGVDLFKVSRFYHHGEK